MSLHQKEYPNVSIIIPVRNEEKYIKRCLTQILHNTYPKDKIEVLVIDGMSEDRTREVVNSFVKKHNYIKISLLENLKRRIEPALNLGITNSNGEIIIRIDARTIIKPDYIQKCIDTLLITGADNVGGIQKPIVDENNANKKNILMQHAIAIAMSSFFGVGNAQFRLGKKSGFVDTVYLGCFKKKIFKKVGMFDEEAYSISEDSDINYRIREIGGKVYLNRDIIAYYYPRDNIKDFCYLYCSYGIRKAGNFIKYKQLTAWRQFIPPTFLLSLILLSILGAFNKSFFYLWFLITGTYILTDFTVSLYLSFKHRVLPLSWRLFLAFPVMHFSWALGFWRRLLQRPKAGEYWGY